MKRILAMLLSLLLVLTAFGSLAESKDNSIYIVYTNDIHSYLYNVITETAEDGTKTTRPGLRLSNIAKMVEDMRAEGKNVLLVDDGDEVQGCSLGSLDNGMSVIHIMNAAGFQLAVPGNHDFDYGMSQFFRLTEEAEYPFITCNFHADPSVSTEQPFASSRIFELGGKKIAFVGVTTPETLTSSTPTYFQDANGNFIYSFDGTENPQDLYDSVQRAVDEVRSEADYVIVLGHVGMGMDEQRLGISSADIIAHTTGVDAFIDGHSHTLMVGNMVMNKAGEPVLLTQTGAYLQNVGVMKIDVNGKISTQLISNYDGADETVAALEEELNSKAEAQLGQQVAVLETTLTVTDPENSNLRLIRAQELNAGDFYADGVYWFFNENMSLKCDVAICNGGGIRATLEAGKVTLKDLKNIQPFGNVVCMITATGAQIRDALEMGVTVTGDWDKQWNTPAENGGFLHVAGMRYTVDATIPSSVKKDASGLFVSVDGEYRVRNIEIYNRETGTYEPIDLEKTYTVGGINYLLRNNGNGLSMFQTCTAVVDFVGQDVDVTEAYVKSFPVVNGYPLVNTQGSALANYPGYLIDYENPYGAGRITILLPDTSNQ